MAKAANYDVDEGRAEAVELIERGAMPLKDKELLERGIVERDGTQPKPKSRAERKAMEKAGLL